MAVAISTAFPRRECLQVSLLDGPQDLARKLRESDQDMVILDLHGLSQTEFLNYGLTLSLGGGFSKELAWCKSLSPKASKMPAKILLMMPPYLAHHLETAKASQGSHVVQEWWLDGASDDSPMDLGSLLQVKHIWSMVRPLCEEIVQGLHVANGVSEKQNFAVELLSEALKRTIPLLNPDDAARVLAIKQLAQRKVELGSFRALVAAVASSSARHAACRFRPWLLRCLASDFSATPVGREILLKSVRMAPLSFMSRLQPMGEIERVLLECPKQLPDSPGPEVVWFPFVEELVAIVTRGAEHSWGTLGARDLEEKLWRLWPDLLLPENDPENTKIVWSCLAHQLPKGCQKIPQAYLESIRHETCDAEALLVTCTEQAILEALSFVKNDTGAHSFDRGPAEVLFDSCRTNQYGHSEASLLALRESSRRLNHPELLQLSALWLALIKLSNHSVDDAWHSARALFDPDATVELNVDIPISIPVLMGLARFPAKTKNILPALVMCRPEAAAFLVARASQAPPANDARTQLQRLRSWLRGAMDGADWSPRYLESPQAKFAVCLMSSWLKGINLEAWLRSLASADLSGFTDAAGTLSVLASAVHIIPKLAQDWDLGGHWSAIEKMAGMTGLRRPVQNYFIRLLAFYHGENLAPMGPSLEPLGDWIHPFIKPPLSDADRELVRQLMFLPQFGPLHQVTESWIHVLQEILQVELNKEAIQQVKAVANVTNLGPLKAAAAIWLALLASNSTSAFAPSRFNPSAVGAYALPLQQPEDVAVGQVSGATAQYQFGPEMQL